MPFVYLDELGGVGALGKKKKGGIFKKIKKAVGKVLKVTPIGIVATQAKRMLIDKPKKAAKKAEAKQVAADAAAQADLDAQQEGFENAAHKAAWEAQQAAAASSAPITPTTEYSQGVPETYPQQQYAPQAAPQYAPQYAPVAPYPEQYPQPYSVSQAPPIETQFTEPEPEEEKMQPTTDIVPEMYPERQYGGWRNNDFDYSESEMQGMIVTKPTPPYAIGRTPPLSAAWLKQANAFRPGGRRVGSPFQMMRPEYSITKAPKVVGGRMKSPFLGPDVDVPAGLMGLGAAAAGVDPEVLARAKSTYDQYDALLNEARAVITDDETVATLRQQLYELQQKYVLDEVAGFGLNIPADLVPTNPSHAIVIAVRAAIRRSIDDIDRMKSIATNQRRADMLKSSTWDSISLMLPSGDGTPWWLLPAIAAAGVLFLLRK